MLICDTFIEKNTMKEKANQVTDSFPFRTACTNIQEYPCHMFPWHWHEDAEILYVTEGMLKVNVPGEQILLNEGDVIFIPSNILHSTDAVDNHPGVHKEYIFSPLFLSGSWNSVLTQKYILPLINNGLNYIIINNGDTNYHAMTAMLSQIYELAKDEPANFELSIHKLLWDVWMILIEKLNKKSYICKINSSTQKRLYLMLEYINTHYQDDITLDQIAQTAGISTRECNRSFKNSLHISTMDYLLEYRINMACTKLLTTSDSITEICYSCGFSSAAYFTKRFREKTGVTPTYYRKQFTY